MYLHGKDNKKTYRQNVIYFSNNFSKKTKLFFVDQNRNFKKMMESKFKHSNKGNEDNRLYIDFLKSCEIESNLSGTSSISPSNVNNSNNSNSNLTGNNPIS